jgi:hypothetical protein
MGIIFQEYKVAASSLHWVVLKRMNFSLSLVLEMANWTTEQVCEWLENNGFQLFIKIFKGRKKLFVQNQIILLWSVTGKVLI